MSKIDSIARLTELIPDPSAIAAAKVLDHLDDQALEFIARSPFLIMATENETGIDLSPKGDDPGFVHVPDSKTLLVPERNGNQLKMGLRNLLTNGRIGLMFFRPATGDVLRAVGRAELFDDADLCERLTRHGKPAILAIRVSIERAFFHCPRAILRAQLWKPESWDAASPVKMGRIYAAALAGPRSRNTSTPSATSATRNCGSEVRTGTAGPHHPNPIIAPGLRRTQPGLNSSGRPFSPQVP